MMKLNLIFKEKRIKRLVKIGPVLFLLFFFFGADTVLAQETQKFLVVVVPAADIRRIPKDRAEGFVHDDLNETQVLYDEVLEYKGENADWFRVEATEQKEFSHAKRWQGYPGWIRKDSVVFVHAVPTYNIVVSALSTRILKAPKLSAHVLMTVSLGTRLKKTGRQNGYYQIQLADNTFGWISVNEVARLDEVLGEGRKRQNMAKEAKLFLGTRYLWGGRSSAGIDCSGLVNLAYRASGIDIPRDAHEQWMVARPVRKEELRPGDLIFLSKKGDPQMISHVMLFLGKDDFIEAPGTGKIVRVGHFKDYAFSGRKMHFGRILP